jgi:hypothetical protein
LDRLDELKKIRAEVNWSGAATYKVRVSRLRNPNPTHSTPRMTPEAARAEWLADLPSNKRTMIRACCEPPKQWAPPRDKKVVAKQRVRKKIWWRRVTPEEAYWTLWEVTQGLWRPGPSERNPIPQVKGRKPPKALLDLTPRPFSRPFRRTGWEAPDQTEDRRNRIWGSYGKVRCFQPTLRSITEPSHAIERT